MLASELSASPVQVAAQMCATAYANRDGAPVYNASGAVLYESGEDADAMVNQAELPECLCWTC